MGKMEPAWIGKSCIMEGYSQFLVESLRMPPYKVKMYVDLVRRFHNHIGKSYVDVTKRDIISYLYFLGENERFKDSSLYIHLAAIKKFYQYLMSRGDIGKIPTDGVSVKDWHKCRRWKENSGFA